MIISNNNLKKVCSIFSNQDNRYICKFVMFQWEKNVNFHIQMRECFLLRFIFFFDKKTKFLLFSRSFEYSFFFFRQTSFDWLLLLSLLIIEIQSQFPNKQTKPYKQKQTLISIDWHCRHKCYLRSTYILIVSKQKNKQTEKKNDKVERKFVI